MNWSSRSIGAKWQHGIFYLLIRLGGKQAAYLLLAFVALYYTLLRPSVRRRSSFYLRHRFPQHGCLAGLWDSYLLTLGIGKVLVDRAVLGILGTKSLSISLNGVEQLVELLREGRGLILVTAHVGSWQLAMSSLAALDSEVSLLIHREAGDHDRHYFEHGNGKPPYLIIDPAGPLGGSLEMLQVLKQGNVLCIMGDRVMGGTGSTVDVEFLGDQINVPISPYLLASATGAPVAVIFPYLNEKREYQLKLAKVIRVPFGLGRKSTVYQSYATEFAASLEEFVSEHPYQFFNFYDMWDKQIYKKEQEHDDNR